MSMSSLRAAPVIALFLACVPAPVLAQSIDESVYYNKANIEFRGIKTNFDEFNGRPKNALTRLELDQDPAPESAAVPALGGIYLADGTNPNGSRYRGMVSLIPSGNEYKFRWWISRQGFYGSGQFAGRRLVVDWGQESPVIYTLGMSNRLEGEWADGRATENLELFAHAGAGRIPGGRYRASGRNPNGSTYAGTANISDEGGGRYRVEWRVGSLSYQGAGTLEGNVLTVDWGSSTPIVYALQGDGRLSGLWEAGYGLEILTPE